MPPYGGEIAMTLHMLIVCPIIFLFGIAAFIQASFLMSRMISILFYRGIVAAVLAGVLQVAAMLFCRSWFTELSAVEIRDIALIVSLTFSFNITFLIVFPVTFDRSVTMYILNILEQSGSDGLTKDEMERALVDTYVRGNDAIGRRMAEQVISGNVEERQGRFILSKQAKNFLGFSRLVMKFFPSIVPGSKVQTTEE